jgi:hypothetical protein
VENGVAGDLGGSARGLGDVVVLEGDHLWGVLVEVHGVV